MHRGDILHRRDPAGADRPDGFVGDDEQACISGRYRACDLAGHDLFGLAGIALFLGFADADDRGEPVALRRFRLALHIGVGLTVIGAPFAMADDHAACACFLEHRRGEAAGMGAAVFGMAILRADRQAGRAGAGRRDERRRRADRDIDPRMRGGGLGHAIEFGEMRAIAVHLPVARDELPARHVSVSCRACLLAALIAARGAPANRGRLKRYRRTPKGRPNPFSERAPMIQFFRNMFSSKIGVVIAILFIGLIGLAFALADINAPGNMFAGGDDEIATVGDEAITEEPVFRLANRAVANAREEQPGFDMQAFMAQGGLEEVIDQYARAIALGAFATENGLLFGKEMIDRAIADTPAFQGLSGQFDEQTFRQVLQQQNLTEEEVRDQLREQRLFRLLIGPAATGAQMTDSAIRPYAELLFERRRGQVIAVPSAAMGQGEPPTSAQINAYYQDNIERYTLPERRAVRYAVFTRDQLNVPAPSDEQIRAYYEDNEATYGGSEARQLRQIVLPSEEQARAFYREVSGGTDFAAAASQRGFSDSATLVEADSEDSFARSTSDAVAEAAFGAAQGELTEPARSDFGWHVIRVESIDSRAGQSLAAVRTEIAEQLRAEATDEALANLYLEIENAVESGANFAEVVEAQGLTSRTTPLVAPNGRSPENPSFTPPPELPPVLELAFTMEADDDPLLVAIEDDQQYALVDVTEVARSAPQPLQAIRQLVTRDFIVERAARRARNVAAGIAGRINEGQEVSEAIAAAEVDLPPPQPAETTRQAMSQLQNVPAPLQLMFRMAEDTAKLVRLPAGQGWFVVVLDEIEIDRDQVTPQVLAASRRQFGQVVANEYAEQFVDAIMEDYPLERDEEAIQALADRLTGRVR